MMKQKLRRQQMKNCGTGSAGFPQLFWCYFPELILSGLQFWEIRQHLLHSV
mgnify:FL=1